MRSFGWVLIFLGGAAACGGSEPLPSLPAPAPQETPPPPPPATPTPRTTPRLLALDLGASAISAVIIDRTEREDRTLDMADAAMIIRVENGVVVPSDISVAIDDVVLGDGTFRLTDITGTIDLDRLELDPSTESFEASARIRVTWSLASGDNVVPVRPLETPSIDVHGSVALDAQDRAHFTLDAFLPGVVFDAAGLAQLSELSIALAFVETTSDMIAAGD